MTIKTGKMGSLAKVLILAQLATAGSGCATGRVITAQSETSRAPAQAHTAPREALGMGRYLPNPAEQIDWDENSPEIRRGRRMKRRALRTVKDYTASEEMSSDVEVLMADAFYKALEELDRKTDDEVREVVRAEIVRIQGIKTEQKDLPLRTIKVIDHYVLSLQRIAESPQAKSELRKHMYAGWRGVRSALVWSGSWIAYISAATGGAATYPFYGLGKFVVGTVRGERLTREEIHSDEGVIGDRGFEGAMFVTGGAVASAIMFQTLLAAGPVAPAYLGIQVTNAVALLVACGAALEGNPKAERVCKNLREIYAFFSKSSDWAAVAGVETHKFFEKHVPIVLRRKKVLSTWVCNNPRHSERVVRRVLMRQGEGLVKVDGVASVEAGKSDDHPVSKACTSIIVTLKPGIQIDDVEDVIGRVIDGVFVDYKLAPAPTPSPSPSATPDAE